MNKKELVSMAREMANNAAFYKRLAKECEFENNKKFWEGKSEGMARAAKDLIFSLRCKNLF